MDTINSHPPGTRFCLTEGIHRLKKPVVPKDDQEFVGKPGAVLSGARLLASASFDKRGDFWAVDGQVQESHLAGICKPASYTGCQHAEGVFFDDSNLWKATSLSELSSGEFFFDYAADTIYIADDPGGHTVEASVTPTIFPSTDARHVLIAGLIIGKFANPAQPPALNMHESWRAIGNEIRLNHGSRARRRHGLGRTAQLRPQPGAARNGRLRLLSRPHRQQ